MRHASCDVNTIKGLTGTIPARGAATDTPPVAHAYHHLVGLVHDLTARHALETRDHAAVEAFVFGASFPGRHVQFKTVIRRGAKRRMFVLILLDVQEMNLHHLQAKTYQHAQEKASAQSFRSTVAA